MPVDDRLTHIAYLRARQHVETVTNMGMTFTLIKPGTKDEFGEILTEATLNLKAHPVRQTPFTREVAEKIAWTSSVDILFYVSAKTVEEMPLDIDDLQQYIKVRFNNKEYEIKHIEKHISFGEGYLYYVIGARA